MNPHTHSREDVEMSKLVAEVRNLVANTLKMEDERERLRADTRKIDAETKFYPLKYLVGVIVGTVVFLGAIVGLVKVFL